MFWICNTQLTINNEKKVLDCGRENYEKGNRVKKWKQKVFSINFDKALVGYGVGQRNTALRL